MLVHSLNIFEVCRRLTDVFQASQIGKVDFNRYHNEHAMVVETVETLEFPPLAGNRAGVSQLSSAEEFPNWLAFERQVTDDQKTWTSQFLCETCGQTQEKNN